MIKAGLRVSECTVGDWVDLGCLGTEDVWIPETSWKRGQRLPGGNCKVGRWVGNFRDTGESFCTSLMGLATITEEQRG